jgi:ribosome biogenesis GTPase A
MAKALREIHDLKNIDMVIEIVDARCIKTSSNPDLISVFNKPKLTVALKADLADVNVKKHSDVLIGSLKERSFKTKIINTINAKLKSSFDKLRLKGLKNPEFYILVVGLPNVGKSSFINFLVGSNKLIVANKPGVTRSQQIIKIDKNLFLYDTPGILVKNVDSEADGFKLALVGTIRRDILPLNEVVKYGYDFLNEHYRNDLKNKYGVDGLTYNEFINHLCKIYNFAINGVNDINRAVEFIYGEFLNGKITKVNYDAQ